MEITPEADAAGWASDVDGRSHFDGPGIHVGFFQGKTYVGILRFDLSSVPPGSDIAYAGLEMVGLDGNRLGTGGDWQLSIITSDVDLLWAMPTYAEFEQAQVNDSAAPTLAAGELAASRANLFVLSPGQRAALARQIPSGTAAFRLDGPNSGEDNLFTWDAGIRLNEELDTKPILRLVVIPPESPPMVIVTSTPTPENVVTAAAVAAQATTDRHINGHLHPDARKLGDAGDPGAVPHTGQPGHRRLSASPLPPPMPWSTARSHRPRPMCGPPPPRPPAHCVPEPGGRTGHGCAPPGAGGCRHSRPHAHGDDHALGVAPGACGQDRLPVGPTGRGAGLCGQSRRQRDWRCSRMPGPTSKR